MTPQTDTPVAHRLEAIDHPGHPLYLERVYAGVLGKLIGVYLGRPIENWSYEKIRETFGQVDYYLHELTSRPLIVTDDDISGTFTFLRALEDYGCSHRLTSEQIGQTWLNYLIEKTTILWWGGMGNSTEHTAYLRLKHGIPAPRSGSMELNSKIVAEQIGAQIFIDGWGLICPGDPARAAAFAERAARVSHDGEAVYAAQVVASMVSAAFVEREVEGLLEAALAQIPTDCVIRTMIDDLRAWRRATGDWRECRERLQTEYGYDKFQGNCHVVPNHGLIILSLLYGGGSFDRSLQIVNTSGWDTDCNSGNVGTILGVMVGLEGMQEKDWRGPVADRLFLPSADSGGAITDAAAVAVRVANVARGLAQLEPWNPANGARFHFSLPGCVQGWTSHDAELMNAGQGLRITPLGDSGEASTPTFIPPDIKDRKTGYVLVASPTLYPSQQVVANLESDLDDVSAQLFVDRYGPSDESVREWGPQIALRSYEASVLPWRIPEVHGYPIHAIGIRTDAPIRLLSMDWGGVPTTSFPPCQGEMWARAWAESVDRFQFVRDSYEFLTQNEGIGMLTIGCRDWDDYRVSVRLTPRMAVSAGIAVRVQGLRRYYAFVFGKEGEVRVDRCLDGRDTLARADFTWEPFCDTMWEVEAVGPRLRLWIDGQLVLEAEDDALAGGGFGFVVEEGCLGAGTPQISPA